MSPQSSRRSFFGKLAGLVVAAGIVPAMVGKPSKDTAAVALPVKVRPEARAVSRQQGTF